MKIPDEIKHDGKTLVRLPRIENAREGDWVMISGKLFILDHSKGGAE